MRQLDVYVNPIKKGRTTYPFVCSLQNNLYDDLSARTVAFVCENESYALDKLSVPITIEKRQYFICLNVLATLETHKLEEYIVNLHDKRDEILSAYDSLFTGI